MNLRPSGYEPDELPGCSTPREMDVLPLGRERKRVVRGLGKELLARPGDDLLSHR